MHLPDKSEVVDSNLLAQVISYYHDTLKQAPEALAFLESKGLVHGELIDRFRLGYANRTLGLRLAERGMGSKTRAQGRLDGRTFDAYPGAGPVRAWRS